MAAFSTGFGLCLFFTVPCTHQDQGVREVSRRREGAGPRRPRRSLQKLPCSFEPETPVPHPLKGTLSREKNISIKRQMIYKPPSTEKHMFSDKLPSPLSAPLPRFLPVLVFVFSLLYHAPIRIKVVREGSPAGEKEQGPESPEISQKLPCSFEPETPVPHNADPEKRRFQAVSKRDQHSWLGTSITWLTAWSVKIEVSDQ